MSSRFNSARLLPPRQLLRWYYDLLVYKVYTNLSVEASKTYLSLGWWLLEPVFLTGVYYVVFGLFLGSNRVTFIPNLIVGVMAWQWFSRSVMNSTRSITNAASVLTRIRINRLFMPMVGLVSDSIKMVVVFAATGLIVNLMGYHASAAYVALPLIVLVQASLITAISFWVALIVPFVQDLRNVISLLMIGAMLGSGVFYTVDRLPPHLREVFLLNPMAEIITAYRSVFIKAQIPDLQRLGFIVLVSMFVAYLAIRFERKFRYSYTRLLVA